VAEVLIGERVVIVLQTAAGGYTPLERGEIVASRLQSATSGEVRAEEVRVAAIESGHAVYVGDQIIVAVYEREAEAHAATTEALANSWRGNIIAALGSAPTEQPAAPAPGPEAPAPAAAPAAGAGETPPAAAAATVDWTGSAQKLVPIFSLETGGVYVGAAEVAGPQSQVDKVKGVAELRLDFRNVGRIYAYIPTSRIGGLDRVQGVSVWATGDVKLLNF
jgi:hypothetical protein